MKSFLNAKEIKKSNIRIKEFYIELVNLGIFKKSTTFILNKTKENTHEFNTLLKEINKNNTYFLVKSGIIWFKIKLEKISEIKIQFKIIKKIVIQKTLKRLNKLTEIIKKLKQNNISNSNINNYIKHYFEYHFMF